MELKTNKIKVATEQEFLAALNRAKETKEEYFDIEFEPKTYRFTETVDLSADGVHLYGNGAKIRGSLRVMLSPYKKENGVVVIPLSEVGITDMGKFGGGPYADYWRVYDIPKPRLYEEGLGLELFYEEKRMPICRYPKEGFINIKEVCGKENSDEETETDGIAEGKFIAEDDIVKTWKSYKNILLNGYWCWDWATQRHKIESLDFETGEIKVDEPYHTFGYRPNKDGKGGRFAALNVREALCEKGEWVIDRENGTLSLIPYEDQTYVDISVCNDIFYADGRECIKIEGFDIGECRGCGVRLENSYKCTVKDLKVKNVGAWGIVCDNSTYMAVENCKISYTAGGGISLRGGDREKLLSSKNTAYKNDITEVGTFHRSYMAAIEIDGVGARVYENKIYNVPHTGIMYSGNNHEIVNNEIDNACYESHDAGAIYTGRNYTFRGNRICYNYIHNLNGLNGLGCRGLYFDDAVSSAEVYGNVFANISFAAIELGGGRDYKFYRNVFKNCRVALKCDDRAGKWKRLPPRLLQRMGEVDYKNERWKKSYPELYNIEENDMFLPLGNEFIGNTVIGGDGIAFSNKETADLMKIERNEFVPDNCIVAPKLQGWYHVNALNNRD